jgi:hypothetical protein
MMENHDLQIFPEKLRGFKIDISLSTNGYMMSTACTTKLASKGFSSVRRVGNCFSTYQVGRSIDTKQD